MLAPMRASTAWWWIGRISRRMVRDTDACADRLPPRELAGSGNGLILCPLVGRRRYVGAGSPSSSHFLCSWAASMASGYGSQGICSSKPEHGSAVARLDPHRTGRWPETVSTNRDTWPAVPRHELSLARHRSGVIAQHSRRPLSSSSTTLFSARRKVLPWVRGASLTTSPVSRLQ